MTDLWNWLTLNAQAVSSVSSIAMAIIWIVYLQIALTTYVRQRRPRIVLDQAHGHGPRSVFILINLSQEPIHISCILVAFNSGDDEEVFEITDFEHSDVDPDESDRDSRWEESLKHGPLQAGEFLILGGVPVDLLKSRVMSGRDGDNGRDKSLEDRFNECGSFISNFEIRVIGVFSTEDRPVGASQKYMIELNDENSLRILPASDRTRQLTSRRDLPTLQQWREQCRSA